MTTAEMLSRVRTLLDEDSSGFWTDSDIYGALNDGHTAVLNALVKRYRYEGYFSEVLKDLLTTETAALGVSTTSISLPTDLYELLKLIVDGKEFEEVSINDFAVVNNSFKTNYFFRAGSVLIVKSKTTSREYSVYYIPEFTSVASGVNSEFHSKSHPAIVEYAAQTLKEKDHQKRDYSLFDKLVSDI